MNSVEIIALSGFLKEAKKLSKKYKSLPTDLEILRKELLANPKQGTPLGKNCYKIRLEIKSKGKGKSGGARVISHLNIIPHISEQKVYLLSIYDKSDKTTITNKELIALLNKID